LVVDHFLRLIQKKKKLQLCGAGFSVYGIYRGSRLRYEGVGFGVEEFGLGSA
jgi:hypothetical protein